MRVPVFVLNYNGRHLLEQCLGSVVTAAGNSVHDCPVVVVDNASTDDSLNYLRTAFPQVEIFSHANVGLCSFNAAVTAYPGDAAILLNNDIRLAADSIDPLLAPLAPVEEGGEPGCFFTAPRCWTFDGETYEGFRTAVNWRWGLIQATARFPGYESGIELPSWTASAGAALAVHRQKFLELGGFDSLYLPGRLEDVDLAFRGYLNGYYGRYVPDSCCEHLGAASFGPKYGDAGCEYLAVRNTLLFQWKNLRHPRHRLRQWLHLPIRMMFDIARAPLRTRERRMLFCKAFWAAIARRKEVLAAAAEVPTNLARERRFFAMFHPEQMRKYTTTCDVTYDLTVHEFPSCAAIGEAVLSEEACEAAEVAS